MGDAANDVKNRFHIVGVHLKSEGYPNVQIRTAWLRRSYGLPEINVPAFHLDSHKRKDRWSPRYAALLAKGIRFAYAHIRVLFDYFRIGRPRNIYIPYPAIFLLYLFSLVPRTYRPKRFVVDAFISVYETVVTDRHMVSVHGILARLIKKIESRAYEVATTVIVDTDLSASYLSATFGTPPRKIISVPLSIDEHAFRPIPYTETRNNIVVLFIGTFVPLQGAEVIARSAQLLKDIAEIRFEILGYGQSAREAEKIFSEYGGHNVSWEKTWMSSEQLSSEIEKSDICLGIFGQGEKTQRVWPIKNYSYMAVGRALITGDTLCARDLKAKVGYEPFATVPTGNPEALAESIIMLARDPYLRKRLANNARFFFETHLSSRISESMLLDLLSLSPKHSQ